MQSNQRDQRPILVIHPDRKTQRTVHRIVGGTFRPVVLVDDLEAAAVRIRETPPFLIVVDHQLIRGEEGRKLLTERDIPCLVLMQDSEPDDLGPLLEGGSLSYLLANPMPLLAEELSITVQKLTRRQIFGLEKYLTWGIEIRELTLSDADQRRTLVDEMGEDVQRAGLGPRALAATLIADELLSNAVFNAPVDDSGSHTHTTDDRSGSRTLADRDLVTLRYACDARYLAIEVEDRYGSLDRRTILRCLTKATNRARDKVSMGTRGAGIGLATVYGSCNHLVFNLEPGRRTQAIALVDVRFRPAELGNAVCSFGIFSTEERRS
jgi:CheY-like chemotaxis protein